MAYDIGDLVVVTARFRDPENEDAPVDPSAVTFTVQNPAGQDTSYTYQQDAEIVRDSEGVFHVDLTVDSAGVWRFRWASSGTGQAADEGVFSVKASAF